MTKSELIAQLAERFPQLVAKDADLAVKMILDAMSEALVRGDEEILHRAFDNLLRNALAYAAGGGWIGIRF